MRELAARRLDECFDFGLDFGGSSGFGVYRLAADGGGGAEGRFRVVAVRSRTPGGQDRTLFGSRPLDLLAQRLWPEVEVLSPREPAGWAALAWIDGEIAGLPGAIDPSRREIVPGLDLTQ